LKQPIVLRVYKGEKLEAVRQFETSQIVIGRNADAQLELQDEGVALLHAMIENRNGEYYLSDLGSSSGTFKNGNKTLEDKLTSGDAITVGPFRIQFFVGVPKPAAPPKPASAGPAEPMKPPAAVAFTTPVPQQAPDFDPEKTDPAIKIPPAPAAAPAKGKAAAAAPASPGPKKGVAPSTRKKKRGTFAPAAPYKDLKDIIKPHKGSVVEVIVAWKDRILSSNHFSTHGSVFMSSAPDADVVVPIVSSKSKYELIKIGANVSVCLTQEMSGELTRDGELLTLNNLAKQNKIRDAGSHFEYDLRQGEMIRIGLQNDLLSIYIRFVAETPKPLVAPLLDMSSSEVTGVILAMAISAILGLYMNIYTPSPLLEDEAKLDEPVRKAVVMFQPRKVVEIKEVVEEPKPVVKPQPKPEKVRTSPKAAVETKGDPGAPSDVKPNPEKKKPNKLVSAQKPGAAIKVSPKEGANMKAEKPDPTKMGLLGVFGTKGTQAQINKAYSGSGELIGTADSATGYAGNADNRDGDNLGGKLKDTGSGKGSSTVGIAGVGTKGRGTGGTGYGTGGIGTKGSVQINVGGQDADFTGSMDREAIRRVIREHLREIRNCYERELQRTPDLYGKVVITWDIVEGGRVSQAGVSRNEIGSSAVGECIAARLKTWRFPDPPKDQVGRVSYPFVFSSQ
jgi:outer membrane biosynthesis protein TonB